MVTLTINLGRAPSIKVVVMCISILEGACLKQLAVELEGKDTLDIVNSETAGFSTQGGSG